MAQRSGRPRQGIFINGTILGERRKALNVLETQRDAVLQHLDVLLTKKHGEREQEAARRNLIQSLCVHGRRAEYATASLQKRKEQVEQQKVKLAQRRTDLEAKCDHLKRERLRSTAYLFPNDLRTHEMALLHIRLGLATDQRLKLRQLLDVLPLTVTGMGKSYTPSPAGHAGGGVAIAVCGLRLPEKLALDTLQQDPAQQLALSASLGYMLLLSELLAAYIGGPVLHEGSFQGSTTLLWQPQSFWDRRPTASSEVLPLFVEKGLSVLGAALGAATGSTAEAQTTKNSSSGWGPLSLLRRIGVPMPTPPSPSSPAGHKQPVFTQQATQPQQQQQWQQQWQWHQWPNKQQQDVEEVQAYAQARHANLDLAFNMLQRTASSLVHDKAFDLGLNLPVSWGPFGWLVMLCAALLQDDDRPHSRLGGVLTAASSCAESERQHAEHQKQQQERAQHYPLHKQKQQQKTQAQAKLQQAKQQEQLHLSRQGSIDRGSLSRQGSEGSVVTMVQPSHTPPGQPGTARNNVQAAHTPPGQPQHLGPTHNSLQQPPHILLPPQQPAAGHTHSSLPPRSPASNAAGLKPGHSSQGPIPSSSTQGHAHGRDLQDQGSPAAQAPSHPHAVDSTAGLGLGCTRMNGVQGEVAGSVGHDSAGQRIIHGVLQGEDAKYGHTRPYPTLNEHHAHVQQHHGLIHTQQQEEEEGGEWEEVGHHHILPPPPSAEEDVLQYVRALYGDGNADGPGS